MKHVYRAVFKPTGTAYGLNHTFILNGTRQYCTLYHTNTSTRRVRITRIELSIVDTDGIVVPRIELIRLTSLTAPSGGTSITPTPLDTGDPAAEATTIALPGVAGSEGGSFTTLLYQYGNTGNNTDATISSPANVLYEYKPGIETKPLILRAGVAEGIALKVTASAIVNFKLEAMFEFTEE